jgi:hypothetical protein
MIRIPILLSFLFNNIRTCVTMQCYNTKLSYRY